MIREAIEKLIQNTDLTEEESAGVMEEIMSGTASPPQVASYLTALRSKGETVEELVGSVKCMRKHAIQVNIPDIEAIDLCGTGGDGKNTFNISTTCAFVLAGAGVAVAKHGNRAASSKCGSADLLEELGVVISLGPEEVSACIGETNLGFMFAPLYHPAMKNVAPIRKELGIRTIFNILGPMSNPANVSAQMIGVFDKNIIEDIARTLHGLGTKSAVTLHGKGGYDEATTLDESDLVILKSGEISMQKLDPGGLGFSPSKPEHIMGGSSRENAEITLKILEGEKGPKSDTVILNSAIALMAAGKTASVRDGIKLAKESINSGRAKQALEKLVKVSQSLAGKQS